MAGTIKHSWTGTVLTIESDAGTSSCDLKGEKGDDGVRGPQGSPGTTPDLTGYATESFVEAKIAAISTPDLTNYATKDYVNNAGFASETYVNSAIAAIDFTPYATKTELSSYATKSYVDNAVAGGGGDLSSYATKRYVNDAIAAIDLSSYATQSYVNSAISNIDFTSYATKTYVSEAISNIDLSNYATKTEIADFQTATQVETSINAALIGYAPAQHVHSQYLESSKIIFSETEPSSPATGAIWLKPVEA